MWSRRCCPVRRRGAGMVRRSCVRLGLDRLFLSVDRDSERHGRRVPLPTRPGTNIPDESGRPAGLGLGRPLDGAAECLRYREMACVVRVEVIIGEEAYAGSVESG